MCDLGSQKALVCTHVHTHTMQKAAGAIFSGGNVNRSISKTPFQESMNQEQSPSHRSTQSPFTAHVKSVQAKSHVCCVSRHLSKLRW